MVLIRRGGLVEDLLSFQDRMNRLLEENISKVGDKRLPAKEWEPPVDIYENDESFVLEVDIPGIPLQQVEVEVEEGSLHIKGNRLFEEDVPSDKILKQERSYGEFHRVFSLPTNTVYEKVKARLKDGVLTVTIPKRASSKPMQIDVDA